MSRLQELQAIPQNPNHSMYDPSKLPLEELKVLSFSSGEKTQAPYFFDEDGILCISMEEDAFVGDYYGEVTDGCPHIVKDVEEWATKQGGYWEWIHPGAIMFVK